jgi:tryptophan-rich sensory protein
LYLASTNSKKKNKKKILVWFGINLFLNAIWTLFYFNLHNPILAFMDIILIELTIVYLIILTYRISRIRSYLLIPYLIWVSFASVLTYLSI